MKNTERTELSLDHIHDRGMMGRWFDAPENWNPSCHSCNSRKGRKPLALFELEMAA